MSEPKMLTTEERHSHMERLRQFVHTDHERDLIESFADHADAADIAIEKRDAEIERLKANYQVMLDENIANIQRAKTVEAQLDALRMMVYEASSEATEEVRQAKGESFVHWRATQAVWQKINCALSPR
jgi:hypothetical protein